MGNNRPVIGITLDYVKEDNVKYSYSTRPWYALRADYARMVTEAGGIALMIPYGQDEKSLCDIIDGLIIPGGDEDINPKFYGQAIISDKISVNDERASFELKIAHHALKINMPFLGICNGLQIINVALGGSLIQHIPDTHASEINHEQPPPKHIATHQIIIKENSKLAEIFAEKEVSVNSTHHQAVDRLGKNLVISALAPDGIIEAIESIDHDFVVGVEWHPEYNNSMLDKGLFQRLIKEAEIYKCNKKQGKICIL